MCDLGHQRRREKKLGHWGFGASRLQPSQHPGKDFISVNQSSSRNDKTIPPFTQNIIDLQLKNTKPIPVLFYYYFWSNSLKWCSTILS